MNYYSSIWDYLPEEVSGVGNCLLFVPDGSSCLLPPKKAIQQGLQLPLHCAVLFRLLVALQQVHYLHIITIFSLITHTPKQRTLYYQERMHSCILCMYICSNQHRCPTVFLATQQWRLVSRYLSTIHFTYRHWTRSAHKSVIKRS